MNKAVFLDKDGTLVENVPYNVDPGLVRLMPGAIAALRLLSEAGYRLIVVSNQPGVALGLFDESDLVTLEASLRARFWTAGVRVDAFYWCPHDPDGFVEAYAIECDCRKPAPGLLRRAAAEHRLDLARCWMVGDILHDVEAGLRAGCRAVLVDSGGETEWKLSRVREPEFVARDLVDAAAFICRADGLRAAPFVQAAG